MDINNLSLSSDTATRSGMYCSVATTIDRCKTEGVVDVFQVVKALRVHKPGAVPSVVSSSAAYIVEGLYHYNSQTLSRACTNPYQVVLQYKIL